MKPMPLRLDALREAMKEKPMTLDEIKDEVLRGKERMLQLANIRANTLRTSPEIAKTIVAHTICGLSVVPDLPPGTPEVRVCYREPDYPGASTGSETTV